MSWDGYIDTLVGYSTDKSGVVHCDTACIIGLDGGAMWTTDAHPAHLRLIQTEAATIANCLKSKSFSQFQQSGIYAAQIKYQFLREEDNKLVLAKKKDCGSLTVQASKTAIVIGHTKEGCQQGIVNEAVGKIAEYLESMNM